ncbi:MAG: LPS export ABC transporter ATP-binding protein [Victivallales bacterium]|jgi:lipopolysaccharide export system ATP-binding protein|nr:LPS export ABC transporter ATP-binding protein [Victivallales bacterium]MBR4221717.1 LPS export ABC transporter ATP-binding protein [Victivallales bacterium]
MANEQKDILLQAEGLVKVYGGRRVVNNVSIEAHPGEVVGLLGPNGAGKTTTFYMIVGLIKPDGGSIRFMGEDVSNMPMYMRARLGMGYLAQEPSIFRKLTVEQNVKCVLETLDMTDQERKSRLEELLEELKLTHLAKQKAMTLSGGERRRLEITRALAANPTFIMLDEPFGGVDPINVNEVQKIVANLRDRGLSVLITDHNVRETLGVVDRAYLICNGEILFTGDSESLVKDENARRVYLGPSFTV